MTETEFDDWCHSVCEAVDSAPITSGFVVITDENDEELLLAGGQGDELAGVIAAFEGWLTTPRRIAAMATRIAWTNDPEPAPTVDSWGIVVVEKHLPAVMFIRRLEQDKAWWKLTADQMPWFALSTAGSLRDALYGHFDFTMKSVEDKRLFARPEDGVVPPRDKHGLI